MFYKSNEKLSVNILILFSCGFSLEFRMQGKGRGNNFTKDNSLKCGHSVAFPDLKN
jgi:hypothetical protein